ncbi:MAG: hypothetical protein FJY98_00535 [Candidatus Liptonbacteria bacterium]|nr:hypothetical protein [Candidatus Liptonbacteria bacterium]
MLLKLSKFFTYASLFCVIVVLMGALFPFIGGKTYWFRVAIELGIAFAFLWWAFEAPVGEAKRRFKEAWNRPLVVAVSFFVAAFLLASIFADNPHGAFWSNYERGEGGFQMLHYYGLFMLLTLFASKREDWERVFKIAIAAALVVVFYGIGSAVLVQSNGVYTNPFGLVSAYAGPGGQPVADSFLGRLFSPVVRFQGSLGNPAYVAPYLMFTMFYCFYLAIKSQKRRWWIGLGVFFFVFLILTQTRGAFLGLGAAVITFFLYAALRGERKLKRFSLIVLLIILLFNAGMFFFHDSDAVKRIPFAGRLYDVSSVESFATRVWTWGSAWEGFKERPLLGWGPENFPAVFDKHFDPRHFAPGKATETWFDRAHSLFFDYLAETGLLGVLTFLGIFVTFFVGFFRRVRHGDESTIMQGLLFALPVGYLVQGLVLFDVLPIYINLFLFLAFAAWWMHHKKEENHTHAH